MKKTGIEPGVVHEIPPDLEKVLTNSENVLEIWNKLTPLARNEWICWIISVKKSETRKQHIERLCGDLLNGKRRPCCWAGCPHR
ncbi:MAG: YdeI/OmpD-associated family protein [Spirochaetes bacterium]|nr:YdeI/OmpD-associated family protein [Spirochaetota bacterium]